MINRRELLNRWCVGFGGLALNQLLAEQVMGSLPLQDDPAAPAPTPHFPATAKRIIFLFMHGGPAHMDLTDPKPELQRCDGVNVRLRGVHYGRLRDSPSS